MQLSFPMLCSIKTKVYFKTKKSPQIKHCTTLLNKYSDSFSIRKSVLHPPEQLCSPDDISWHYRCYHWGVSLMRKLNFRFFVDVFLNSQIVCGIQHSWIFYTWVHKLLRYLKHHILIWRLYKASAILVHS